MKEIKMLSNFEITLIVLVCMSLALNAALGFYWNKAINEVRTIKFQFIKDLNKVREENKCKLG